MTLGTIAGIINNKRTVTCYTSSVGSAKTEIIKQKVLSPVEKCFVKSGFCAFLILRYDDPENPQLEAMNSVYELYL